LIDLLLLVLIVFTSLSLGNLVLGLLKLKLEGPTEVFLYSTALGLGLIAQLVMVLGFMGLFYHDVILSLFLILLIVAIIFARKFTFKPKTDLKARWQRQPLWFKAVIVITLLYMLIQLLNCMTPVTNGDSIAWYLSVPKHFLENHGIMNRQLVEDYSSSNMPQNLYMLSVLGMTLSSEILSQLILGWLMSILAFLAIYVAIKSFTSRRIAFLGAALFYTMPTLNWLIYSAKMDMGYVMFELCFWSLLLEWFISKEDKVLYISAIFLGLAIGSKYHSLLALAVVSIGLFIYFLASRLSFREAFTTAFIFGIISLAIGSPSLIKNLYLTGDPFYPMFKGGGFLRGEGYDLYKSVLDIPKFIYAMVFGKQFVMRPLYMADKPLGFLPFIFFPFLSIRKLREYKSMVIIACVYIVLFHAAVMFSVWPFPRHILPAVGLMVILSAVGANTKISLSSQSLLGLAIALVLLYQVFYLAVPYYSRDKAAYLLGRMSKAEYLSNNIFDKPRGTHMNSKMLSYVKSMPQDTRILALDDGNGYYVPKPFLKKSYVYDGTDIGSFVSKCKQDSFSHIYFSDAGIAKYTGNKNMDLEYVILGHKDEYLEHQYSSQGQHIYRIRYEVAADY
jgi:hypothetical protein